MKGDFSEVMGDFSKVDLQLKNLTSDLAELAAQYRQLAARFNEVRGDFRNSAPNWPEVKYHFVEIDKLNAQLEAQLKVILVKSGVISP
jgi:uncharacterized protein (DUF3084 family)